MILYPFSSDLSLCKHYYIRHYTTHTAADSAQFFWEESVLPDTADRFQLKIYSKTANMHTGPQSLITTALHQIQEQCTLALNHTQNKKLFLLSVCRQTLLHYHLSFKSNLNNNPFCKVKHPGTHTHTTHLYTTYISNLKKCVLLLKYRTTGCFSCKLFSMWKPTISR